MKARPRAVRRTRLARGVLRVGDALDVTLLLEVIHERAHRLLGDARGARQRRETRARGVLPERLEDRGVRGLEVVEPRALEPLDVSLGHHLRGEAQQGAQTRRALIVRRIT